MRALGDPAGERSTAADRVTAVVVTHNRCALLLESLAAVTSQQPAPTDVIVVDNASTDGTGEAVAKHFPDVRLITLHNNTGGAGGFAVALDAARQGDAVAIWLLDDDAVPTPGALAALLDARNRYRGRAVPAGVASKVVWTDGRIHPMNIPRRILWRAPSLAAAARDTGCEPIRSASFCSLLVDAEAARVEDLPIAAYFIWNDDVEYTARLLRERPGLFNPESIVVHKTANFYNTAAPGGRFSYDVRNTIWMLTRSSAFRFGERVYYAAAALDRWIRTVWNGPHRLRLLRLALQGALAAVRRGPQPTAAVLRGTWAVHSSPGQEH